MYFQHMGVCFFTNLVMSLFIPQLYEVVDIVGEIEDKQEHDVVNIEEGCKHIESSVSKVKRVVFVEPRQLQSSITEYQGTHHEYKLYKVDNYVHISPAQTYESLHNCKPSHYRYEYQQSLRVRPVIFIWLLVQRLEHIFLLSFRLRLRVASARSSSSKGGLRFMFLR